MAKKEPVLKNTAPRKKGTSSPKKKVPSKSAKKHRAPLRWPWALAILILLLILPSWAAVQLSQKVDWRFVAGYFTLISGMTLISYRSDKQKAGRGEWRIPEETLHLWELLGGWPAALFAQRILRHKTKKAQYQAIFWLIIFCHQLVFFEFVSGGFILRSIGHLIS